MKRLKSHLLAIEAVKLWIDFKISLFGSWIAGKLVFFAEESSLEIPSGLLTKEETKKRLRDHQLRLIMETTRRCAPVEELLIKSFLRFFRWFHPALFSSAILRPLFKSANLQANHSPYQPLSKSAWRALFIIPYWGSLNLDPIKRSAINRPLSADNRAGTLLLAANLRILELLI